jgi:uncharacterized protein (DUF885 family)
MAAGKRENHNNLTHCPSLQLGAKPMRRPYLLFLSVFILGTILGLPSDPPSAGAADPVRPFALFVDDYFDAYFTWKPSEGTAAGLHQYDSQLENRSAAAVAKRIEIAQAQLQRLEKLRKGELNSDESIDAEVLDGRLRAELLGLKTLESWRRNPMAYVSTPAEAIDALMKRNFAPANGRLRSVIARLKATPPLFEALRANVDNPPREFTDLAITIGDGSVSFFRDTLAAWAKQAAGDDSALLKEFTDANAVVIKALEELVGWLKKDLLPRSKGAFALGAERYAQKLLYEDLVDTPLEKLLALAEATLRRDRELFAATAMKIDSKKTPSQLMDLVKEDHAAEDDLIPAARRTIEKTRQFLIDKRIIKVPSEVRPIVTETPVYARYGSGASLDPPGAYETKATEAFYYVTPVEKDWDKKKKEEHLRAFNNPIMQIVTIHEAFPGHFIQFLYAKDYPTKTRKLAGCNSNIEGWAHYTEQMMLEEGYGNGDPKIRLAQLSEALLRDCRFVVALKLHTAGMTVEQATKFFEEQGYQEHAMAYEEARRGTYDPTYLVYTLGKLQIYELRRDYFKAKGAKANLEDFHNQLVKQGGIPIKLIRRILLPADRN